MNIIRIPKLPSLSRQLLIRCAGILIVGTILTEGLAFQIVRKGLENQIRSQGDTITQTLEFTTEGLLDSQNRAILQRVVENYALLPAVIEVAILDPAGNKLAYSSRVLQTQPLMWAQTSARLDQLRQASQSGVATTLEASVAGKSALIQILPFSSTLFATQGKRGLAVAVIDREEINQEVVRLWFLASLIMVSGIVMLLIAIGWLINRLVLDPVAELNQRMRNSQSAGKFQIPLDLPPNEILYLAQTYDQVFRAEQEALSQLQEKNTELARATQLKDEFLANMSHELRTPLNAILGMAECFQDGIYGDLNSQQLGAIATIQTSGSHLLELINTVLDVAKIQSGKLELDIAPTLVTELCYSCLALIKPLADKRQITLIPEICTDVGTIDVDERMMRQVILNLLSNAVKFTPNGGRIWLKVEVLADPVADAPATPPSTLSALEFQVIDTGIGIEPEHLAHIFDSFVQVNGRYNRQYAGTGLGLTLVKHMTELHGGSVGVTSTVGQGSCFTIRLPYHQRPEAATRQLSETLLEALHPGGIDQNRNGHLPSQSVQTDGHSQNQAIPAASHLRLSQHFSSPSKPPLILIAEDNLANFDTFSEYLMMKGFQLIHAHDGKEAVQMTQQHQPDLVLMDIQMPKVSGLEAIQQLRSIPKFQQLPIIALTALASIGERERCLAAGASEYLSKPLKLRYLLEVVQQQLAALPLA